MYVMLEMNKCRESNVTDQCDRVWLQELIKVLVRPSPITLFYIKNEETEFSRIDVCLDLTVPLHQHIPRLIHECRFALAKPIIFRRTQGMLGG
jgi:hypothetical protein